MNETAYREAETRLWNSVGHRPNEKMVALASTGTRVRVQVVGDGPPVLFIHGGPNAGSTWAPIIGAFDGYTCLMVDRPGTGLSDGLESVPELPAFMEFADRFVADVLGAMDIDRADVVASSLGGYVALRSAVAAPDRIRRMVQMACPAFAQGMLTPPFMKIMRRAWFRRLTGVLPPSPGINDRIMRQMGHGPSIDEGRFPQAFRDWYLDLQRHTDTNKNDGNLIGKVFTGSGWDQGLALDDDLLASVTTPTLFLWGELDGFGGKDVAEAMVGSMPNASLEMIGDSGHLPWLDFPAEIGARTRTYLDDGH
ncbi:MAG: alpha/beta fold hydrolase [Acidimicrobiia bacterium]